MSKRFSLLLFSGLLALGCLPKSANEGSVLKRTFEDDFNRDSIGDKFIKTGGTWVLKDGALHSSGEKNIPLWLDVELPTNVKIEFTAWSLSDAVDTKVEVFGDGKRHESGYIIILGGWNNQITTIARLDEHQKERVEIRRGWEKGRRYRWRVQRTDGRNLDLFIDDELVISYRDASPLKGKKHNKLAFSNWASEVFYDDLKVTPLK